MREKIDEEYLSGSRNIVDVIKYTEYSVINDIVQ